MATKPVLVDRFITNENPEEVTKEVETLVAKLLKEGYIKIKVIVHGITVETASSGVSYSWYSTTVIATMDDVHIDIGFPPD